MDIALGNLVREYLHDFERKKSGEVVVKNAIPIVWFGDMDAYQKSPVKIVTVGLNPSRKEFDCGSPRFNTGADTPAALYATLCNYFNDNPYTQWFAQFEKCLKRLSTSYGGKMSATYHANTAISIDVYSSIATDPTWRGLTPRQKQEVDQQELCERLLGYLQPDVILMSVAHDLFMQTLHISDSHCLFYEHRKVEVYRKCNQICVYGRNMQGQPFGGISNGILNQAFETVRQALDKNN